MIRYSEHSICVWVGVCLIAFVSAIEFIRVHVWVYVHFSVCVVYVCIHI